MNVDGVDASFMNVAGLTKVWRKWIACRSTTVGLTLFARYSITCLPNQSHVIPASGSTFHQCLQLLRRINAGVHGAMT